MINYILRIGLRIFILILLQVLIFNNIRITTLEIVPCLYVLVFLALPFATPNWLTLIVAFVVGLIIDFFQGSFGMHAASSLVLVFFRPLSLGVNILHNGYETGKEPLSRDYGAWWFVKYSFVLIFIHQLVLYTIDEFSFSRFHITLLKVVLASFSTFIIVFLAQLLYPLKSATK